MQKPFPIPVSYFGIVLGLLGLGLAWQIAEKVLLLSPVISRLLFILGGGLWCTFLIAYIIKWLAFRTQAKAELQHIIQCCFISLIPITTILLGMALSSYQTQLAFVLIMVGIVAQVLFAAYRSAGLWQGTHSVEATTPVFYLPTVGTNLVSSLALTQLGYTEIAWMFWGAGMLSWLLSEAPLLQRLRTATPLPEAIRPTLGILLAPSFVASNAYLALNGGQVDMIVLILLGYGCLQAIYLIRLLPWICKNGFTPGFWAFSFGLAAIATLGIQLYQAQHSLASFGLVMFSLGSMGITSLLIGTLYLIIKGRFFVKAIPN